MGHRLKNTYNFAHVISSFPDAVVTRSLAGRAYLFCVRRSAYGFFSGIASESPPGRFDRWAVARSAALHGDCFRDNIFDFVDELQPGRHRKSAADGSAAFTRRPDAAADADLAIRHFSEDACD